MVDLVARTSNHRFQGAVIRRALATKGSIRSRKETTDVAPGVHRLSQRLGPGGIDAVAAAYRSGESASAIATRLGLSRQSVNIIAADAGLPRKVPRTTSAQRDEIVCLYQSGLSQQTVADALGFSQSAVHLILKRRGTPITG